MLELDDVIDEDIRQLHDLMRRNAEEAAGLIQEELRSALDVPYPPASRPGSIPHRRSGRLRAGAYASTMQGAPGHVVIVVGDDAPHAEHVEKTRPFIEPTLDRLDPQIQEALFRGI